MSTLLHELHHSLGAQFTTVNQAEVVADYGDAPAEYSALTTAAGVIDLSSRSRLCLVGEDRGRFLHGQVTNDVKSLQPGTGIYATVTTAKGKLESDLNILCLAEELLLDCEPGLTEVITARLERFIVADDVQIVDAAPHYGLLVVAGPRAAAVVDGLGLLTGSELPGRPYQSVRVTVPELGDLYLAAVPRLGLPGFDLYVPNAALEMGADKLIAAARAEGGRAVGWTAWETARIEAGIPRFGQDMDGTNLPLECGLESRAISYRKGCYIGQEVINRIHSVGHVNRALRGLRLADDLSALPVRGDQLWLAGKAVGYVTSAIQSPKFRANIALAYVRREVNQPGTELDLKTAAGTSRVRVVELPGF